MQRHGLIHVNRLKPYVSRNMSLVPMGKATVPPYEFKATLIAWKNNVVSEDSTPLTPLPKLYLQIHSLTRTTKLPMFPTQ
jgi:hypothetical protein